MSEKKERNTAKLSLTINGGTVIERLIYIGNYNPEIRYGIDIRDAMDCEGGIVEQIEHAIKMQDVNFMYDKVDLRFKEKWVGKTGKTYKKKD